MFTKKLFILGSEKLLVNDCPTCTACKAVWMVGSPVDDDSPLPDTILTFPTPVQGHLTTVKNCKPTSFIVHRPLYARHSMGRCQRRKTYFQVWKLCWMNRTLSDQKPITVGEVWFMHTNVFQVFCLPFSTVGAGETVLVVGGGARQDGTLSDH